MWYSFVALIALLLVQVNCKSFLETPISFPIHVNVVFLGFRGDGPLRYVLPETRIAASLRDAFSTYTPYSLQSKSPLNIRYNIDYTISFSDDIMKYEAYLRKSLAVREGANYSADIASAEGYFEKLQSAKYSGNYTIYFVHPNKDQLLGRFEEMDYTYSLNGWGSSQSWVGSGRYVVIDMTAGPVSYGKMTGYGDGEGAVNYESFPRIIEYFLPSGYQGTSLQGASAIEIEAHISSLIISATKYLFASDIHADIIPHAEKLLIPVIVFRNHNEFNPFEEGINMEIVRHEALRMALPGQTIQIISANHYIHEHAHISMALSRSFKTDTSIEFNEIGQYRPQYRPYVDSKTLAYLLRTGSDILGQGLLGNSPYASDLQSVFNNKNLPPNKVGATRRSIGTRVLPVYVFSVGRNDPKLLLDKYHQVAAFGDMVIVLQTNFTSVSVPYFSQDKPIFVDPKESTKAIVAGLASALGSITPPNVRYSNIHGAEVKSYLWAQGRHPFGHFTNSSKLSQIFVDRVTRNSIMAKIHNSVNNLNDSLSAVNKFAADYFLDPMDPESDTMQQLQVVSRIETGTEDFKNQFEHLSRLLADSKLKDAYTVATTLEVGTGKFLDYTIKEIEIAENDLFCCIVSHRFQNVGANFFFWICAVAASIFLFVTCYKAMRRQWTFLK